MTITIRSPEKGFGQFSGTLVLFWIFPAENGDFVSSNNRRL
jgi:hypothetical protein